MEVVKGKVSSIAPPTPEVDNPLTVPEALNAVNAVLLNYRGFDKVKAILATAQQAMDDQCEAEKTLLAIRGEIEHARSALVAAQNDITQAQAEKAKVHDEMAANKKAAVKAAEKVQAEFQKKLDQQQADFEAGLKQQALDAQTALEDNIAGLKRELGGLNIEKQKAQDALDVVTQSLNKKTAAYKDVQAKLDAANAALEAIKARL